MESTEVSLKFILLIGREEISVEKEMQNKNVDICGWVNFNDNSTENYKSFHAF